MGPTQSPAGKFSRRYHAVGVLLFGKVDRLNKQMPVSPRYIAHQMERGRLSDAVARSLRETVGEAAFAFITGTTDTLLDQRDAHV